MRLYEKYRPRSWNEVVAQDKVVGQIRNLCKRGLSGHAYYLVGASGTGTTTIARLMASEFAGEREIYEVSGASLTPSAMKEIHVSIGPITLLRSAICYIIDSPDTLPREAIGQILIMLDRLPAHAIFIFTTRPRDHEKFIAKRANARLLLSRCIVLKLARRNLGNAFAARVKEIAEAEHLGGKPLASYLELARQERNNMRAMLQHVESGKMVQ
jgi:DNA polymerase-3 subunit gamma/tau